MDSSFVKTMSEQESKFEGKLVRHSFLLLVTTGIANVANVAFHMFMGRRLLADEYGILSALLGLMLILATPLDALRNAMAHFSARAHRAGDSAQARAIARHWSIRIALVSIPFTTVIWLFRERIAAFFHLATPAPVLLIAIFLIVFMLVPVVAGVLQGLQRFWWFGASMHGWSLVRLGLGIAFVISLAATAYYGVLSHALSQLYALLVAGVGVWWITRDSGPRVHAPHGIGSYFIHALFMLGAYGVIMNSDIMLVRHFFPERADEFARAATIGRSVVFLPQPIAMAMFPKVISAGGISKASRLLLLKALAMVVGMIGVGVGISLFWPWLPLWVLYGIKEPSPELAHLVRVVMLALCPLGISYLLLHFEMAQHRFGTVPWLIVLAVAYIGAVMLWHGSVLMIVAVLGTVATASALLYLWVLLRPARSLDREEPLH